MTDNQLIRKTKDGCSESFNELINRHSNIFYKTCNKYISVLSNAGIQKEDIYDNKNIIFFDCIRSFDPKRRIKFSTWLCNNTRFFCLNLINSRKKLFNFDNEDYKKISENTIHETNSENEENLAYAMFILDSLKDKRIKKIKRTECVRPASSNYIARRKSFCETRKRAEGSKGTGIRRCSNSKI
mgnify:CR=1 FL=1